MQNIFKTPDIFVQSFNPTEKTAIIAPMTREGYINSDFLDSRKKNAGPDQEISLDDLFALFDTQKPEPRLAHYIFHTTFCGSTLLARCLEMEGVCLAYKEPHVLHNLSFKSRPGWNAETHYTNERQFQLAMALSTRTYSATETALIKPSESCNILAAQMLEAHPASKGLMLYGDLENYCISMLRHETRRKYLRATLPRARIDLAIAGYGEIPTENFSDAQAAGMIWLSLMALHQHVLENPLLNVRSLNATDFYDRPIETLEALCAFFNLDYPDGTIEKTVKQGAFVFDSKKTDIAYDKEAVAKLKAFERKQLVPEIEAAKLWVEETSYAKPIPSVLSRPLLG